MPSEIRTFARRLRREATGPEGVLWNELRDRRFGGYKFKRQVPIDRFVVDFLCVEAGIVVELDGRQHEGLTDYDAERSRIIRRYGYEVVRFANSEIMDHPQTALARLRAILDRVAQARRPSPGR